jgi:flavorubredoxin
MWGATESMAKKILEGIVDSGVSAKLYHIPVSDRSEVIYQMFGAKGILIGCSTHDNDILPNMAGFLEFLKGLKPKNRIGGVFGSQGWAGGALKSIEAILAEAGIVLGQPALSTKYTPDEAVLKNCYEFGKLFAASVNKS